MNVVALPILKDNYCFALRWERECLLVDPGSAKEPLDFADKQDLHIHSILLTHHHMDHVGGIEEIVKRENSIVYGPAHPSFSFPFIEVNEDTSISLGPYHFKVMHLPGHTLSHLAFFEEENHYLFCGDVVFGAGCGRLFEGTAQNLYQSFQKVKNLPKETLLFCGHEYTEYNLQFALSLSPLNREIGCRMEKIREKRQQGLPSVPFSLEEELRTNPFFLVDDENYRASLKEEARSPLELFTVLRKKRDAF